MPFEFITSSHAWMGFLAAAMLAAVALWLSLPNRKRNRTEQVVDGAALLDAAKRALSKTSAYQKIRQEKAKLRYRNRQMTAREKESGPWFEIIRMLQEGGACNAGRYSVKNKLFLPDTYCSFNREELIAIAECCQVIQKAWEQDNSLYVHNAEVPTDIQKG